MKRRRKTVGLRNQDDEGAPWRLDRAIAGLAVLCTVVGLMLSVLLPEAFHPKLTVALAVCFAFLSVLAARLMGQHLTSLVYFLLILALACAAFALLIVERQPLPPTRAPMPGMTELPTPTRTPQPTATATRTPTVTRTPTPTVTPTPAPPGGSRANPLSKEETIRLPDWQARVLAVQRGDAAWQTIKAANQFNRPPPDGKEYVLVTVQVTYTGSETSPQSVSAYHWRLTGSRYVRYSPVGVVTPKRLDGKVFSGGQVEGSVAFLVAIGETNLILIYGPQSSGDKPAVYVALDDGARLAPPPELADIQPDKRGMERTAPARMEQTITYFGWQVTALEAKRGDAAWQAIKAANQFNKPPDQGMEYVLVRVRLRYVAANVGDHAMPTSGMFSITGNKNVLYSSPGVVPPTPTFEEYLYAGGETEGWVVGQCADGETGLLLHFRPPYASDMGRFIAIE